MRFFYSIILAIILMAPAFANESGTSPLIIFRGGAARTTEVAYTKNSNITNPDIAYEFIPVSNDRNPMNYTHNGSVLQYSPPAPEVQPNHVKFLADVLDDASGNITATAKRDTTSMGALYLLGQKQIALKMWLLISGTGSAPFIRTHATNNGFTLP